MKTIATLLFTIFLPTFLAAQPQLTNDRLDVQQTIIKMFEALSDRDSVSLKSICSPDITLYEYGQVWSIDTLVTRGIAMNQSSDFKRTNTFEFINTTADKTTAWVTYRLISAITKDGKQKTVSWLETVILERDKKRWKVKHLHSTLLKSS